MLQAYPWRVSASVKEDSLLRSYLQTQHGKYRFAAHGRLLCSGSRLEMTQVIVQAERADQDGRRHEDGSPQGRDPSIDGAWFTTAVPEGACPTYSASEIIAPRVDRVFEELCPWRKDHTFCATPARRQMTHGIERRSSTRSVYVRHFPISDHTLGRP